MGALPNNTQNQGGLVGLIQGVQRPLAPAEMEKLPAGLQKWIRDLTDYLRRLLAVFTPANILITINQATPGVLVGFRYHAATHKFQIKRVQNDGTIGDWEDAEGDQPVAMPDVVEGVFIDAGELKDLSAGDVYVLEKGTEQVNDTGCKCFNDSITPSCDTTYLESLPPSLTATVDIPDEPTGCGVEITGSKTIDYTSSIDGGGPGWIFETSAGSMDCVGDGSNTSKIKLTCSGIDGDTGLPMWVVEANFVFGSGGGSGNATSDAKVAATPLGSYPMNFGFAGMGTVTITT